MLDSILNWVFDTPYSVMMRDSLWGYPIAETLHLFGIITLFGTILMVDLRFIGLNRNISARALSGGFLLKLTWAGFALVVLSGLSLFAAYAPDTIKSPIFIAKILLIALAGMNMMFFHFRVYPHIGEWDIDVLPSQRARWSAAASITLWVLTIIAGRLIAYPEIFE